MLAFDSTDMSFPIQVAIFSACKILIGIYGAGLANVLFMESGGHSTVIELFPLGFRDEMFAVHAWASGHRYMWLANIVQDLWTFLLCGISMVTPLWILSTFKN